MTKKLKISDEKLTNTFLFLFEQELPFNEDGKSENFVLLDEFIEKFETLPPLVLHALLTELSNEGVIARKTEPFEIDGEDGEKVEVSPEVLVKGENYDKFVKKEYAVSDLIPQVEEGISYLKLVLEDAAEQGFFVQEALYRMFQNGFHTFAFEAAEHFAGVVEVVVSADEKKNDEGEIELEGGEYSFYTLKDHAHKGFFEREFKQPELISSVEAHNK